MDSKKLSKVLLIKEGLLQISHINLIITEHILQWEKEILLNKYQLENKHKAN
jgi:hypothetical protein